MVLSTHSSLIPPSSQLLNRLRFDASSHFLSSSLILGPDSDWQPIPLTELITAAAVKKAYRKATLCVHPDKLTLRGASIQHKYICEKVFDLLREAWTKFNSEER